MGVFQTKYSANNFWNDILFHIPEIPPVTASLTTDSLDMIPPLRAHVTGTIVNQGSSDVAEYGFVWATHDNPTVSDNKIVVGTEAFSGIYSNTTGSILPFVTVYFAAYAINSAGTSYGNTLNGVPLICFASGTLVMMANGRKKKIEHIKYSDDLLVWNFDDAKFDNAKPIWMVKPFKSHSYGLLRFDNGLELKTVADGNGHRIFNIEKNIFTYSMSEDTPVGTRTFTEKGKTIKLIGKKITKQETKFYNIVTHTHMNIFANNILTSTGLNNIYPIVNMKFIKDDRQLIDNEFGVPDELFIGLRLSEQPKSFVNLKNKIKHMVSRQYENVERVYTNC